MPERKEAKKNERREETNRQRQWEGQSVAVSSQENGTCALTSSPSSKNITTAGRKRRKKCPGNRNEMPASPAFALLPMCVSFSPAVTPRSSFLMCS